MDAGNSRTGGVAWFPFGHRIFPGGDENQSGCFRSCSFPLDGDAAGDGAASVAEEQFEENVNHEVEAEDAKGQKNGEGHRCQARTGEALPPWKTGSDRGRSKVLKGP